MDIKTEKSKENWLKFDFPVGCVMSDGLKEIRRRDAASLGTCCPYYFCDHKEGGCLCGSEISDICAEKCEKFYEEHIKEKEK